MDCTLYSMLSSHTNTLEAESTRLFDPHIETSRYHNCYGNFRYTFNGQIYFLKLQNYKCFNKFECFHYVPIPSDFILSFILFKKNKHAFVRSSTNHKIYSETSFNRNFLMNRISVFLDRDHGFLAFAMFLSNGLLKKQARHRN